MAKHNFTVKLMNFIFLQKLLEITLTFTVDREIYVNTTFSCKWMTLMIIGKRADIVWLGFRAMTKHA